MASFNKFNCLTQDLCNKAHNLGAAGDAITVALCATANAPVATNAVLTDLTQISYTNLSARVVTTTSCTQTSGTVKLILADLVLTSSTGDVAAFQYVVLYNGTAASHNLIGWYDYGSAVTLHGAAGDTFTLHFDSSNGVFTIG